MHHIATRLGSLTTVAFGLLSIAGCQTNGADFCVVDFDSGVEQDMQVAADMSSAHDMNVAVDMTVAHDMNIAVDMAVAHDMNIAVDMAVAPDMNVAHDMAVEPDAGVEPDMATTPDMHVEVDMDTTPDMHVEVDMGLLPDLSILEDLGVDASMATCPIGFRLVGLVCELDLVQGAYVKASNTEHNDYFGQVTALSADGNYLVVATKHEASNARGINGDQDDNSYSDEGAGAAYIFFKDPVLGWTQQAYVKSSNLDEADQFGISVAIAGDGSRFVVGASSERSVSQTINTGEDDNSSYQVGAAYVFVRSGATWSQEAYIKAPNGEAGDAFGSTVAMSSDGSRIAVGAMNEGGDASSTIGSDNNNALNAGAVYIFDRVATTWSFDAYLKASNADSNDAFGLALAFSQDGNMIIIGAPGESSASHVINSGASDNSAPYAGAAYLFQRTSGVWSQTQYLKPQNTDEDDAFGSSVAISADGTTIAVGAPQECSNATGVDSSDDDDNSLHYAGAAYVFVNNSPWQQMAYLKASDTEFQAQFGFSIAISGAGDRILVGAPGAAATAGAAYLFLVDDDWWSQGDYLQSAHVESGDSFGFDVSMISDGTQMSMSAICESGASTGVGGDETNNDQYCSGAVFVFGPAI